MIKRFLFWLTLFGAVFHVSEAWADTAVALLGQADHLSVPHIVVMVLATVHILQHK